MPLRTGDFKSPAYAVSPPGLAGARRSVNLSIVGAASVKKSRRSAAGSGAVSYDASNGTRVKNLVF